MRKSFIFGTRTINPELSKKEELKDIIKAWAAISLAFGIVLYGGPKFELGFLFSFIIAGVTVGIGFLFHELAHRTVARYYGCRAFFKADPFMLILAIGMSLFGFVFAAPGAVYILGYAGKSRNGKISIAGPLTNIVLSALFLVTLVFATHPSIALIGKYGHMINAWLAAFNLIPFGPFDGKKVFAWNKWIWGATLAAAVVLLFAPGILL
ncbi:MAG: site-2 protease family protein [Candidatus Woesearchaeota archaeon]